MKTNINEELKTLESVRDVSSKWNLPENSQRPCLMRLHEIDIPVGERNKSFHIMACDLLNRQNKDPEFVEKMLLAKNTKLSVPLSEREVKQIINSASKKKLHYKTGQMAGITYGCDTEPIILRFCIGKESCPYYKQGFTGGGERPQGLHTLMNKGWLPELGGSAFKTYGGLCRLEKMKGIKPGRALIFTHRELARLTGLSRPTVAETLKNLFFAGLILYIKGKQHKKYKTASDVRRIIPIPDIGSVKKHACPM